MAALTFDDLVVPEPKKKGKGALNFDDLATPAPAPYVPRYTTKKPGGETWMDAIFGLPEGTEYLENPPPPAAEPAPAPAPKARDVDSPISGVAPAVPGTSVPRGGSWVDTAPDAGFSDPNDPNFADYALDVAQSAPSGLAKLASETVQSPVTMLRAVGDQEAQIRAAQEDYRRRHGQETPWWEQPLFEGDPAKDFREWLYGTQDAARTWVDENTYEPKYGPGKFTEEAVQWIGPSLWPSRATRMMTGGPRIVNQVMDVATHGAAPWAAYEAAENYGPPELAFIAALATDMGLNTGRTMKTPEARVRFNTNMLTPAQWRAAADFQAASRARGIDMSAAEAIAQTVNDPNHPILKTLRFAEASSYGAGRTGPFFRDRDIQNSAAFDAALADIAARPDQPQVIGPRVQRSAEQATQGVLDERSAQTDPHYQTANLGNVQQHDMAALIADLDARIASDQTGLLAPALREYRNALIATQGRQAVPAGARTPVLNPDGTVRYWQPGTPAQAAVPETPQTNIEQLDRVRKEFRDRSLPSWADPNKTALTGETAREIGEYNRRLNDLMRRDSNSFAAAQDLHGDLTEGMVEPVTEGPLGKLKDAKTTEEVGKALLPDKPRVNETPSLVDALERMMQASQSMTELPGAFRQRLEQLMSDTPALPGNNRQFIASDFVRRFANPENQGRLRAGLGALGLGNAADNLASLFDIYEAQGKRLKQGSPTAELQTMFGDMKNTPSLVAGEAGITGNWAPIIKDVIGEYVLRGNVDRLAQIVLGDVANVRGHAERAWSSLVPEALRTSGVGGLAELFRGEPEDRQRQ